MKLISFENVSIKYDSRHCDAISGVTFDINSGDYICIVGENGSGKSTLLKGMLGLIPPSSGSIAYSEGFDRTDVGYLPQHSQSQKNFPASVREVVLSGNLGKMKSRPFYSKREKERANYNMERLSVMDLAKRPYSELSGGQQQRVLLARALCASEKLIALDEPLTGLDPLVTSELYQIISEINKTDGLSVVMITHDVANAVKHAKKILHLSGKAEFFGDMDSYIASEVGEKYMKEI
jgi:ABC-type Mn/Zn transport systems, ATPase component